MKKHHVILMLTLAALSVIAGAGCSARAKKTYLLERANHWYASGQFEKAEIEYLKVLHADPENALAIGRLGVIYFDEGRFQKAAPFLFRGNQLATNNLEIRADLGQIYLAVGNLKEAHNQAEFVLEENPRDTEAPILFAQSVSTDNEITAAQKRLDALAQNGDDAAVETALGVLASRERHFQNALKYFQRALAIDSHFASAYAGLGNLFWQQGELPKAESSFKAAADCSPSRSLLQLQYGQFETQTGNFADAKNFFTGLAEKAPDYIPAWLGLAEVALDEKEFDDCATALNKALRLDPDNVDAQVLNARLDLARSNIPVAIGELERLSKLYPQSPRIHYQLALACIMDAQMDEALNQLHDAVDIDPGLIDAEFLLAQLELKSGDADSAVVLLKQLIASQPALIQAKLLLADAFRLQKNYSDALAIYMEAEKSHPKNPKIPLLAGLTYVQQQNETAARQEFDHALHIDPSNVDAQEELAQLDLKDMQFTSAQQRIEKIISKYPQQPQPRFLLAKIFLAEGQTNEAESMLSKIAALPGGSSANLLLAQLYFNSQQDQKALDAINLALQENTNDTSALMLAGLVETDQKDYRGAADSYEKLLAINPQNSPALNNLAWLYCDYLGDLDKAYDLAQRARQLLPNDPSTADTMGWVFFKKGQYLPALNLFQDSANTLADNPEVQFHLGIAHYMLGDEEDARNAFQAALDLGKTFPEQDQCQQCLAILNIDPATADDAARASLEKRISERPDDPIAFERLAAVYQRDKDTHKTAALCETALKANPRNFKAAILLAQIYAPADPQKAFALAKTAYQIKPDDTEVCATLGRLAFQNGNDQWAYALLDGASQNQPNDAQILFDFANAAFCIGKISEAQTAMQNASQIGLPAPQSTAAQNFLDMIALYQNPDNAAASQTHVEDILASNPGSAPALLADGIIETRQENPVGAERDYEKLLSDHPDCTVAQKNLAILYAQNLVDPQKAYPVAIKANEAFPDDPQVSKALALILFQRGDYARAADLLSTISDSATADAELFYCLGISEFHLKNFLRSKTSLQHALNLNLSGPQATDARQTLAELNN